MSLKRIVQAFFVLVFYVLTASNVSAGKALGDVCLPQKLFPSDAEYRYNELVFFEFGISPQMYSEHQLRKPIHSPEIYKIQKSRMDQAWTLDRRNPNTGRRLPVVYYPPIYITKSSQCGRRALRTSPDEFLLFAGKTSPRVKGDLCSVQPIVLFDENRGRVSGRFLDSLLLHDDGYRYSKMEHYRWLKPAERDITAVLAIIETQCDVMPQSVNIRVVHQDGNIALNAIVYGHQKFDSLVMDISHISNRTARWDQRRKKVQAEALARAQRREVEFINGVLFIAGFAANRLRSVLAIEALKRAVDQ